MSSVSQPARLPLGEARRIVRDLLVPNPLIYWADFLFHVGLGWTSFVLVLALPPFSLGQGLLYLVCSLALYRAVIFTHELAHLKKDTFKLFRFVWNVTCGFPLMVPSFTYHGVHNDHHKRDIYGTKGDGEYLPFAVEPPSRIVLHVALGFALPLLLLGRFVVLTPLSYLHRRLRRFVWQSVSSLTIDLGYRRPGPTPRDGKTWRLEELATFGYGGVIVTLAGLGLLSPAILGLWYLVSVLILVLNSLRTLAAHGYRNPGDRSMDFERQYLDSVNIPGHPFLTALWAPVGLRYHATHHLFPTMPYHNLGEAHRRLIRDLPESSVYLSTTRKSLWEALRRLWRESRASQTQRSASGTPEG